jgi:hypothetical protein
MKFIETSDEEHNLPVTDMSLCLRSSICTSRIVLATFSTRMHSSESSSNQAATTKSKEKSRTPMGRLDDNPHPEAEKQPLRRWPDNVNPTTGEIGGPSGPEPTRYGDWERKGKCVDF